MADGDELGELVEFLNRTRGFDFAAYKRPTFERRLAKRMDTVGVDSPAAYVDYLEVHPAEFDLLFDTLLINVTGFFRDRAAWDELARRVVPELLAQKADGDPVRVWCAACSTGEEAYSAAIMLHQILGDPGYRARVKVYGTDLDEGALGYARQATYTAKQVEGVPPDILEEYFEAADGMHTVRSDVRRTAIFGRNDLIQDAPISRVDLLVCRNALIYFTADTQNRILDRLHFALRDDGILFVGKSELLIRHSERFDPVSIKQRIFRKRSQMANVERYAFVAAGGAAEGTGQAELPRSIRDTALDVGPVGQIAVDAEGNVLLINRQARTLFGLHRRDVGRPLQDLEVSYRPADLRSPIEQAWNERRPVQLRRIEFHPVGGDLRVLDIEVVPVIDGGDLLGASVTFADVTAQRRIQTQFDHTRRELEGLQEELQSTVEELETTNEELQSTNEELETTNEELQSTNEELETTNEELHSVNAELEATNDEARARGEEVDRVNAFLETILTSMGVAVVVVDGELRVQVWNDQAEELWGLRADEAEGVHLLSLDITLPTERLVGPVRTSLANGDEPLPAFELDTTNRRGRPIRCTVRCLPLPATDLDQRSGAVILLEATPL
jgi:two-component system CheB/CheR fusion protein